MQEVFIIIESLKESDVMECKCGEISVGGGDRMLCSATRWSNFIRVDDEGNEIIPVIQNKEEKGVCKPSRQEILKMLDDMEMAYCNLPANGLSAPCTNYDLLSVIMLVTAAFRADDSDCK